MEFEPKSIQEHIECLARTTGASTSFVSQVKQLFTRKGISLESAAAPYLRALEEAFRREEGIRTSSWRAERNLTQLQTHFNKVGQAYVKRFQSPKQLAESRRTRKVETQDRRKTRSSRAVSVPGDHRTYVTRPERDDQPMVPGPKDIQ